MICVSDMSNMQCTRWKCKLPPAYLLDVISAAVVHAITDDAGLVDAG